MSTIVYKVCQKKGRSRLSMCACAMPSELVLRYPLNRKVKAKTGQIFAFDNLANAKRYMKSIVLSDNLVLLECRTTSYIIPLCKARQFCINKTDTLRVFKKFWTRKRPGMPYRHILFTPPGTVGVQSLTPIKEIKL